MKWAIAVLLAAGFLFAANFVFFTKPVSKRPKPPASAPVPAPLPVPVPPMATATVVGRVLTADEGKPVAGAVIDYDGRLPFVKSGPDGSFRLEGVPPGRWSIAAWPAEHTMASRWLELAAGQSATLDLFVLPGAALEGRVIARGDPVPGATVRTASATKSTVTGPKGDFVLRGFLPGSEWVVVEATGFLPQEFSVEIPPGVARVPCMFEVRPSWKAMGTVLLEGRPVAGARVSPTWRGIADPGFAGGITAADGTFVLESAEDLEEGLLWAWREGVGLGCSAEVDFEESMTHDGIEIPLPPSDAVPIHLVDDTGAPVAGAIVEARLERAMEGGNVHAEALGLPSPVTAIPTDAEGKAVLTLQEGDWKVRVRADGFFGEEFGGDLGVLIGHARTPIVLRRGGDLEGTVVDGEGRPVEGAEVHVRGSPPFVTGADGGFRFRSLMDEEQVVVARKAGFSGAPSKGASPGSPVTMVLRPASTIRGRVFLADGKTPARAFTVRLWFEKTEDGTPWKDQGWAFRTDEVTDAEGRFVLPDVEPGIIGVEAECGDNLAPRVSVATGPGVDPPEVSLVLGPAGTVAGVVLDPKGTPVAGARVFLDSPWGGKAQAEDPDEEWANVRDARTGDDGRYEFRVVPAGRYEVRVVVEKFFESRLPIRVAATGVQADAKLRRGGELVVETTDAEGEFVAWDGLDFLRDEGEEPRWVDVMKEGEFLTGESEISMTDLHRHLLISPGSYRARLTSDGFEPVDLRFVVKEGETTVVKAILKKSP